MTEEQYKEIVTVRNLISLLLDRDMDEEVIVTDKCGMLLRDVNIKTRKNQTKNKLHDKSSRKNIKLLHKMKK